MAAASLSARKGSIKKSNGQIQQHFMSTIIFYTSIYHHLNVYKTCWKCSQFVWMHDQEFLVHREACVTLLSQLPTSSIKAYSACWISSSELNIQKASQVWDVRLGNCGGHKTSLFHSVHQSGFSVQKLLYVTCQMRRSSIIHITRTCSLSFASGTSSSS
jgi:hypothetical protein